MASLMAFPHAACIELRSEPELKDQRLRCLEKPPGLQVHLLNDERGAVIETLIARTQRTVHP